MRFYFLCLIILFSVSCKEKFDTKTYEENRQSLAEKEQSHPEQFLKVSADNKKNLFGATVVKGKITNTASVCSYKSTRIKILCYRNGIQVEEHEDVLSNVIRPETIRNFKIKYHLPKGTDSVAVSVMSAVPVSIDTLK